MFSYPIAKTICSDHVSPFLVFSLHCNLYNLFFILKKFLNTSTLKKICSDKLSGIGHEKVVLSIYWRNILVWTLVYQVVCVYGFETLRIYQIFVNERLCEIVLTVSGSSNYDFNNFFASKLSFDAKCLLLLWDSCKFRQRREW